MKPLPRRHGDRWLVVGSVMGVVALAILATAVTPTIGTDTGPMAGPVPHVTKNGCTVAALPGIVDDEYSEGLKVSPSGRFILGIPGYDRPYSGTGAGLWHHQDLTKLPHELSGYGGGVNSSGTVAAGSYVDVDGFVGVVAKGEAEELHPAEFDDVDGEIVTGEFVEELVAINDSGDVAGTVGGYVSGEVSIVNEEGETEVTTEETPVSKGALWPNGSTNPVVLKTDGPYPRATAVTEDGRVLGYASYGYGTANSRPWIWKADGTGHELPRLSNDRENVAVPKDTAGDWVLSAGEYGGRAYRWRLSEPEKPEKLNEKVSATSIDGQGRVYGFSAGVPVMLDGNEIVELPTLDDAHGGANGMVMDTSDDGGVLTGLIYPSGQKEPGPNRAVRWDCER